MGILQCNDDTIAQCMDDTLCIGLQGADPRHEHTAYHSLWSGSHCTAALLHNHNPHPRLYPPALLPCVMCVWPFVRPSRNTWHVTRTWYLLRDTTPGGCKQWRIHHQTRLGAVLYFNDWHNNDIKMVDLKRPFLAVQWEGSSSSKSIIKSTW